MFGWKRGSQGPGGRRAGGEGQQLSHIAPTSLLRAEAASSPGLPWAHRHGHVALGLPPERAPIVQASGFREPDAGRTDFFLSFF